MDSGAEGHGAGNDGITGAHSQSSESQVHRGRAGAHGQGSLCPYRFRKFLLKAPYFWASRDPIGAQSFNHLGDLFLADQRRREGQEAIAHRKSYGEIVS